MDFQHNLGSALITMERKKAGRPSTASNESRKKKLYEITKPTNEGRLNRYNHFPIHIASDKQGKRCKISKCMGRTRVMCKKCNVYLCFNGNKNCFLQYHEGETN